MKGTLKRLALVTVLVACLSATVGVARAWSADVLILSTTVTGGAGSREATTATALGLSVEIASPVQWAAKTTAEFAAYKAIIFGDPTCQVGDTALAPAVANIAVWSPAITGNVIVIGTDPTFHFAAQAGAQTLTNRGINFAAADAGRTGLYATLSCYYHFSPSGTPVPALAMISGGGWTVRGQGANAAHIVASHPALTGLTDALLSNWSNSTHEGFVTWPSAFLPLVINTDIPSTFVAADGTRGAPYIMARGRELTVISDIKLAPLTGSNPVGTTHTLTATVTTSTPSPGTPVVETTVTFRVISGPNTGVTGTGVTNASGQATFTYIGAGGLGQDTIQATFVDARGNTQTSNNVTKDWVLGGDTTKPTCLLTNTGTDATGKKFIEVTVRDTGSGLQSIIVLQSTNANTVVPAFLPGTTDPVIVKSTKIVQTSGSTVRLRVTDVAGNVTECDPVLHVAVRESGKPVTETFTGVPQAESKVTINNGNPGVKNLELNVNGTTFKVTGLKDDAIVNLDISSAMRAGNDNTITVTAHGKPGASAFVVISD